jgi:hypothetical protein
VTIRVRRLVRRLAFWARFRSHEAVVPQPWLEAVWQDGKYVLRGLARNSDRRVYALLAVLTLALGVGGTAPVFSLARALLFDPLPYAHERAVGTFWKKTDWTEEEFLYVRGRVPGFRQVALYRPRDLILRDGDGPARLLPSVSASSELFDVLGAVPAIGRGFQATALVLIEPAAPGSQVSTTACCRTRAPRRCVERQRRCARDERAPHRGSPRRTCSDPTWSPGRLSDRDRVRWPGERECQRPPNSLLALGKTSSNHR